MASSRARLIVFTMDPQIEAAAVASGVQERSKESLNQSRLPQRRAPPTRPASAPSLHRLPLKVQEQTRLRPQSAARAALQPLRMDWTPGFMKSNGSGTPRPVYRKPPTAATPVATGALHSSTAATNGSRRDDQGDNEDASSSRWLRAAKKLEMRHQLASRFGTGNIMQKAGDRPRGTQITWGDEGSSCSHTAATSQNKRHAGNASDGMQSIGQVTWGDKLEKRKGKNRPDGTLPWPLRDSAPVWWEMHDDDVFVEAADSFDAECDLNVLRVHRLKVAVQEDHTSLRKDAALRKEIYELFKRRYIDPMYREAPQAHAMVSPASPAACSGFGSPGGLSRTGTMSRGLGRQATMGGGGGEGGDRRMDREGVSAKLGMSREGTSGRFGVGRQGTRGRLGRSNMFPLAGTIWEPRSTWADSKDYYDTRETFDKWFNMLWKLANTQFGLTKLILQTDDDGTSGGNADADEMPNEVEAVGVVLWQNKRYIYYLFMNYATLGEDLESLSLKDFTAFIQDHKLASKHYKFCKKSDIDRLFIQVGCQAKRYWENLDKEGSKQSVKAQALLSGDKAKALGGIEFVGMLVRIAINRYVLSGQIKDVSEALQKLFDHDILPFWRIVGSEETDEFRREFCYTQAMTIMLKGHEEYLRHIFDGIAGIDGSGGQHSHMITYEEWMTFLRALNFIGSDLTERDAQRCFAWSRMIVINPYTIRGRIRDTALPFEGFLEALIRVANLKSLPTDDEIEKSECEHAGAFMMYLKTNREHDYRKMIEDRATPWGEVADSEPLDRCTEHTLEMIFYTIEADTHGSDGLEISVRAFAILEHGMWLLYPVLVSLPRTRLTLPNCSRHKFGIHFLFFAGKEGCRIHQEQDSKRGRKGLREF